MQIQKAVKEQIELRAAITGPAGAGKTYTALRLAFALAGPHGKILVIDTERKSARKYAGEAPDGFPWEFDVIELPDFGPVTYTNAINMGIDHRYDVIIIDSLSHAWEGPGGILELQEKAGGRYQDWAKVNPIHYNLVEAILNSPCHMLVTMRAKMEYAIDKDDSGKTKVTRLGLAPVQRKGIEYEFDFILDLDWSNLAAVDKTRCSAMTGKSAVRPGPAFFQPLVDWLNTGEPIYRFDHVDLLFTAVKQDFGIERDEATQLMKDAGFTGFRPQNSHELYRIIKAAYETGQAAEYTFDTESAQTEPEAA